METTIADGAQQALFALCGTLVVFFIISPVAGYYLHGLFQRMFPTAGTTLVLLSAAGLTYFMSFALLFMLGLAITDGLTALLLALIGALLATLAAAGGMLWLYRRGQAQAQTPDYTFRVGAEDRRDRPRNLRRR